MITRPSIQTFRRALRRARSTWQAGLLFAAVLDTLSVAGVALLLAVLADLLFAPEEAARRVPGLAAAAATGLAALAGLARVVRCRDAALAHAVDAQVAPQRRPVFGAWELLRQAPAGDGAAAPLHTWLVTLAAGRATALLVGLRPAQRLPWRRVARAAAAAAAVLAVCGLAGLVHPEAMRTSARRVLRPSEDIPPWSRLRFTVTPAHPVVAYGGSTNLTVTISGGAVRGPVWLVTRVGDRAHRAVCFQETPARFGQRLEQVVEPVSFCFATPRARSTWQVVDLRLQPLIAAAVLTVEPPAYSGLPREERVAGREPLRALAGTRLTLHIASNRPLLDGSLRLRAADGSGLAEVAGQSAGSQAMAFTWTLERNAELEAVIRDVRGTPCRQPLRLVQHVRPDLPPAVTLSEPPPFALATPSSRLPVVGAAEDDLGLRRADVLRAVVGFRDRAEAVPVDPGSRHAEFRRELALGPLGVTPGQTLEFYLEAADSNPSLAGLAASEVATVRIISDGDYAAMLRTRTTMEHFAERFQMLAVQTEAWRQALREMRDLAQAGAPAKEQAEALAHARAAAHGVGELARQLAQDFPIYRMEQQLAQTLRGMQDDFDRWTTELDAAQPGIARLEATAEHILAGLGDHAGQIRDQVAEAELAQAAARVLMLAGDFRALLEHQRLLERRLAGIAFSTRPEDREQLPVLGERQAENERRLDAFVRELRRRAAELPDAFVELRTSAGAFANASVACGAATNMLDAAAAARNTSAPESHAQARAALDKLEALVSRCQGEGFGGMCQGKQPRFKVSENVESTLAQMLASILRGSGGTQPGPGEGGSTAGGIGGTPDDGYWMSGNTPLNIPTFGPPRGTFATPSRGGVTGSRGAGGTGAGGGAETGTPVAERLGAAAPAATRGPAVMPEWLPAKYQDAVKRYFGTGE
jgi:hypothetical protein